MGCVSILSPISGVPAHRLPPQFHARPKNNLQPIDISRLRQPPPKQYLVDSGDFLGIFIEGVLGTPDEPPPFHTPEDPTLPPAVGYPVPVREDGTLPLPLVPPIQVRGLPVTQIEQLIRKAYIVDQRIVPADARIIVTLMRRREYQVIVVRQDGEDQSRRGEVVKLAAYQNDVMNALAQTGGLPGFDAKAEVKILRSTPADMQRRDAFVQHFYQHSPHDPCLCFPPLPEDPAVIRIPLRLPPGEVPRIRAEDIILQNGDIVMIEGREREVFYTGGLLGGGEHPLPRDYDLDVISAMSLVGGGVAQGSGRGGGRGGGGRGGFGGGRGFGGLLGQVPPGQLFILRPTPCGDQITIAVDLNRALRDPQARPLIQPGDILVLRHKPEEELLNFGIGTFFTFGIAELIRSN